MAAVSSLWIGKSLPKISIMCINSFLKNNYKFNLYTYGKVKNVPEGVTIKDANKILPEKEIFSYRNGSTSAFSNYFRFTMIYKTGEIWVDTDIYCNQFYDFAQTPILIVSEPTEDYSSQKPTSNIICFPKNHPVMKYASDYCSYSKEKILNGSIKWGLGPKTIKHIVDKYKLESFVMDWRFSNNCNNHHYQILYSKKMEKKYRKFFNPSGIFHPDSAPDNNYFIHLWNEHFRYKKTPQYEMFNGKNMLSYLWNKVSDNKIPSTTDKILITGASGLVGTALMKKFKNYKIFSPRSSQLNLLNYNEVDEFINQKGINVIIHLAANVGGLFKNMNNKVEMLEDNLLMNFNVLKAAHNNNVKKVVSVLSTCIFPDDIKYPISEKDLHQGPPHQSNDAYAFAKRMLDIHSKAYREQFNDNFVTVIPPNIYGYNDNYNLENSHVIPALIHKAYNARNYGTNLLVKGSGKPLRQFIYSDDLAELIYYITLHYDEGEPIILAPDESQECSIKFIAQQIANYFKLKLEFDTSEADGQYKKTADNTKLRNFLKDFGIKFEFKPVVEGLKESIEWFENNYEVARK